jgi:hypothetical protein
MFLQINTAKLLYQELLKTTTLDVGVTKVTSFFEN